MWTIYFVHLFIKFSKSGNWEREQTSRILCLFFPYFIVRLPWISNLVTHSFNACSVYLMGVFTDVGITYAVLLVCSRRFVLHSMHTWILVCIEDTLQCLVAHTCMLVHVHRRYTAILSCAHLHAGVHRRYTAVLSCAHLHTGGHTRYNAMRSCAIPNTYLSLLYAVYYSHTAYKLVDILYVYILHCSLVCHVIVHSMHAYVKSPICTLHVGVPYVIKHSMRVMSKII